MQQYSGLGETIPQQIYIIMNLWILFKAGVRKKQQLLLTWMGTAMHDMGSLGRTLQIIDFPRDWANLALYRDVWRGVVSRC